MKKIIGNFKSQLTSKQLVVKKKEEKKEGFEMNRTKTEKKQLLRLRLNVFLWIWTIKVLVRIKHIVFPATIDADLRKR